MTKLPLCVQTEKLVEQKLLKIAHANQDFSKHGIQKVEQEKPWFLCGSNSREAKTMPPRLHLYRKAVTEAAGGWALQRRSRVILTGADC